jgi:hypothetical protein
MDIKFYDGIQGEIGSAVVSTGGKAGSTSGIVDEMSNDFAVKSHTHTGTYSAANHTHSSLATKADMSGSYVKKNVVLDGCGDPLFAPVVHSHAYFAVDGSGHITFSDACGDNYTVEADGSGHLHATPA